MGGAPGTSRDLRGHCKHGGGFGAKALLSFSMPPSPPPSPPTPPFPPPPPGDDSGQDSHAEAERDDKILIVVGAHPIAEREHRAIAYTLRQRMAEALCAAALDHTTPEVLVCTDVWYLNDESIRSMPTVSIGAPGVNALTAFLASKLPSAFVIDDVLIVQLDPEMHTPLACCWGSTREATARAVDAFVEKYMGSFLEAAV